MKVNVKHPSKTSAVVAIIVSATEMTIIKNQVLARFQNRVKVPGFREGKIPENVLEKHVNSESLQSEFLEEAIQQFYTQALQAHSLRPADRPEIAIKKFVPFTTLEFEAKLAVIGEIKLPDYKKIKLAKKEVTISAQDIADVLESIATQSAEKKDVNRPAKDGDQVWIDFQGTDDSGQAVNGADGENYPLVLGSKSFIPGFEENLIGLKGGEEKTFTLTFPKDYGVKALGGKAVTFKVQVSKVQEMIKAKLDDAFAATAGPFKTLVELKADIKKQLTIERQREADRAYENELIEKISASSQVDIPEVLVNDQIDRIEQEERQNLAYRGQTWPEHLAEEKVTEEEHRQQKRPQAEERVKASLVLAQIAEYEKIEVTPEELEIRLLVLKGQYKDPQMQTELDKPETRRDIAGRILTEKTLARLVEYSSKK